MLTSVAMLTKTFRECLFNPGFHTCNLYRTDGITQSDLICQLYANCYRGNCYRFTVQPTCQPLLAELDQLLASQQADCIVHMAQHHPLSFADTAAILEVEGCADGTCPFTLLQNLKKELQRHNEELSGTLSHCPTAELMVKTLHEDYANYKEVIVCLDCQVPAMGHILNHCQVNGYPYSFWKCLHQTYCQLVLAPRMDLMISHVLQLLNTVRDAKFKSFLSGGNVQLEEGNDYELFCTLQEYVGMIAEIDMDEVLVHRMEDSRVMLGCMYARMLEQLKEQTQRHYAELITKLQTSESLTLALNEDLGLLARAMLPQAYAMGKNEAERAFAQYCETQAIPVQVLALGSIDDSVYLHDQDVKFYVHNLGLPHNY